MSVLLALLAALVLASEDIAGHKPMEKSASEVQYKVTLPKQFDFPSCNQYLKRSKNDKQTISLSTTFADNETDSLIGSIRAEQEKTKKAIGELLKCNRSSHERSHRKTCSSFRQHVYNYLKKYAEYQSAGAKSAVFAKKSRRYLKTGDFAENVKRLYQKQSARTKEIIDHYKSLYIVSAMGKGWEKCVQKSSKGTPKTTLLSHTLMVHFDKSKKSDFCTKVQTQYSASRNNWVNSFAQKKMSVEETEELFLNRNEKGAESYVFDLIRDKKVQSSIASFADTLKKRNCDLSDPKSASKRECQINRLQCLKKRWCKKVFSHFGKHKHDVANDMSLDYHSRKNPNGVASPFENLGMANHYIHESFSRHKSQELLLKQCAHAQNQIDTWRNYRGWKHLALPFAVGLVVGIPFAPALAGAGFAAIFTAEAFLIGGAATLATGYLWAEESLVQRVDHNLGYRTHTLRERDRHEKTIEVAAALTANFLGAGAVAKVTVGTRFLREGISYMPR